MLRFSKVISHQHTTRAHCSDQTGSPIKNSQRIFETFHQRRHSDSHCSLREPSPCRLRDPGVLMSVEGVPGHRFESSSSANTTRPNLQSLLAQESATNLVGIRGRRLLMVFWRSAVALFMNVLTTAERRNVNFPSHDPSNHRTNTSPKHASIFYLAM